MMEEKFIQIDGNNIRYLEYGCSKNVLVLIHGLGASAERWSRVSPIFAKRYRVIVPDLIGFGQSDKPVVDYTPEFFSTFLASFFAELGIERLDIVGSSLGGQIVAEYASTHQNNIKQIILVSPAGMMKQSTPALDAYIMSALYPNEQSVKNAFESMEASGNEVDDELVQEFIKRMQMPNAKLAFMSSVLGLKNSEIITSKLHKITNPTMVIWGTNDPVLPIQYAESFISSIKNCKFRKMDGCGHTPYVQDPATFSSIVLDFLSEN